MRAIEIEGKIFVCALYKHFPPYGHRMGQPPEELLKAGKLNQVGYSRFKTWQNTCGLSRMDGEKCRACAHYRRLEERNSLLCMISLDGKFISPVVDKETFGLYNRVNTSQRNSMKLIPGVRR
ncbi:MAG: hypothetical protein WC824_13620 [Bacteroidota bacterium]|jgi:hypothetical protein